MHINEHHQNKFHCQRASDGFLSLSSILPMPLLLLLLFRCYGMLMLQVWEAIVAILRCIVKDSGTGAHMDKNSGS